MTPSIQDDIHHKLKIVQRDLEQFDTESNDIVRLLLILIRLIAILKLQIREH